MPGPCWSTTGRRVFSEAPARIQTWIRRQAVAPSSSLWAGVDLAWRLGRDNAEHPTDAGGRSPSREAEARAPSLRGWWLYAEETMPQQHARTAGRYARRRNSSTTNSPSAWRPLSDGWSFCSHARSALRLDRLQHQLRQLNQQHRRSLLRLGGVLTPGRRISPASAVALVSEHCTDCTMWSPGWVRRTQQVLSCFRAHPKPALLLLASKGRSIWFDRAVVVNNSASPPREYRSKSMNGSSELPKTNQTIPVSQYRAQRTVPNSPARNLLFSLRDVCGGPLEQSISRWVGWRMAQFHARTPRPTAGRGVEGHRLNNQRLEPSRRYRWLGEDLCAAHIKPRCQWFSLLGSQQTGLNAENSPASGLDRQLANTAHLRGCRALFHRRRR